VVACQINAKMKELDRHFRNLRGTAATKFYIAGIPERAIAEIMAWDEETVHKIIRRYVGKDAATKALILQLNSQGIDIAKLTAKLLPET
jgi:ssRNA-specific RNase YbeY (16S rRNA maturation enzyme)